MIRAHGTRTKYTNDKCRCVDCTAANTQYQRDYAAGRYGTMNADVVRERILALYGLGWTTASLSRLTGYSESGLSHICNRGRRVTEQTAYDILSVPLTPPGRAA